jgi:hypothetical protein
MLTNGQRAAFLEDHVEPRAGALVRRSGHFAGKPIQGDRFLVGGRQFETAAVRRYLATGTWRPLPKRRTGKAACSLADRRAADDKLMALMREQPRAGVRQLARALGLSHSCVSRRITRLKAAGRVDRVDERWAIDEPVATRCAPWVPALQVRERGEDLSVQRYG